MRWLGLILLLLSPACAGAADPSIEDLGWIAGSWVGRQGDTTLEEHWLPPKGGLMLGLHRDVAASGKAFFEYLRIEAGADGIVYVPSPGGGPSTRFDLLEIGEARVVFENPQHDFPQRILYWREGDVLRARIEGERDGETRSREWRYDKVSSTMRTP